MLRTLAFAFRRKGATAMAGMDLRMLLAYDLRWFAPEDAKRVVQRALETGALVAEGETVRAAFDIQVIDIPLHFRPTVLILDEEPRFEPAPQAPAPSAPLPPSSVPPPAVPPASTDRAAEDERRRRGLLVSVEVARLVVRRRLGEDVAPEAAQLEAALLSAGAPARP